MQSKTAKPVDITYRTKPCDCGCNGTDSWHKKTQKRVVRNIVAAEFEINATDKWMLVVTQRGVVKAPWGDALVLYECPTFDGKLYTGWWRFAPNWMSQDFLAAVTA